MAIQIVDNFQVNIADAIDNRLVVGPSQFYTDKDDLPYKYTGMRVWDLNSGVSGVPYVWTGTTFSTEASSGIAGSGTPGVISKFIGGGNVLADSIIKEVGVNIGIGTISPDKKLTVAGDIKSTGAGGFYGKGTNITDINANNITSGTLTLTRLQNGTTGYILTGGGGSPVWTSPGDITVGNSTDSDNILHTYDSSTTSYRTFLDTSTGTGYHTLRNSAGLSFKASNSSLNVAGSLGVGPSTQGSGSLLYVNGTANILGNVGIGAYDTGIPGLLERALYKLYVNGLVHVKGNLGIGGNAGTTYKLYVTGGNTYIDSSSITLRGQTYIDGNYNHIHFGNLNYAEFGETKKGWVYRSSTNSYLGIHVSPTTVWGDGKLFKFEDNGTFETPKLAVGAQLGSKFDAYDNTSSNYVARIYNDAGSASGGGGLYIRTNNNSSSNLPFIIQSVSGTNRFYVRGDGNMWAFGSIRTSWSDERLKHDIKPMNKILGKVMDLNVVNFKWNKEADLGDDIQYGVIAQQVEEIIPDLVYDFDDKKHLNKDILPFLLIKSLQEQQEIIKDLEKRIEDLES
jgi:hypothetical protein